MPLNTIYQVRLRQNFGDGGKALENVFFFDHTAGAGVAIDLAQVFENLMLPAINALQTAVIKNSRLTIINLGDLSDFIEYPLTGDGDYATDTLPAFAAVGYTLKLNTRAVRGGSKRIAGVPESVSTHGTVDDGAYITKMNTLKTALQSELTDVSDTFLPIVVKRIKTPVVGTVPLQYDYRLPVPGDTLVYGEVVTALTSVKLSHQVSRG